jgi:hypothetical protein
MPKLKIPLFNTISRSILRSFRLARLEADCHCRKANSEDLLTALLGQTDLEVIRTLQSLGLNPELVRTESLSKEVPITSKERDQLKSRIKISPTEFFTQFFKPSSWDGSEGDFVKYSWQRCWESNRNKMTLHDLLFAFTEVEHSPLHPLLKKLDLSVEHIQRIITETPH